MKQKLDKISKLQLQTIIFDLDGTLIDTEPSAALAIQECFSEWEMNLQSEDASFVTGRTWNSAFSYLFKKYAIPMPEEQAKKRMMDCYRKKLEENLTIVPGSIKAVQSLAADYPLGLVSGSGRSEILWALNKLQIQNHFKIILGAEDYAQSKPNPDGYLKALTSLQMPPESCLVFEDSTAGITSARSAGTWVVAITSTNHFRQDISKAHFKIPDLTEVTPDWIRNLSFD